MAMNNSEHQSSAPTTVSEWLLQSDPAIRWQAMRDLLDQPAAVVTAERSRVATEGWGARLLDLQAADGQWGGATFTSDTWTSTFETLALLRELGVDPTHERTRRAIDLVREHVTWRGWDWDGTWRGLDFAGTPFFEGEVEPCINGRVLAIGAYFGHASQRLVDRLLNEQLPDGGWNCEAERGSVRSSFHTTICVLEGLLAYEQANSATAAITAARHRAQNYLLERRLLRSLSSGQVIDPRWTRFSFPTYWHYDVLWGLDYLRRADVEPDARVAEAVDLVVQQRDGDGRWPLNYAHPDDVHFEMESGAGQPSRWNTLRALRVLRWHAASG